MSENRLAVISIIVENRERSPQINAVLSDFGTLQGKKRSRYVRRNRRACGNNKHAYRQNRHVVRRCRKDGNVKALKGSL